MRRIHTSCRGSLILVLFPQDTSAKLLLYSGYLNMYFLSDLHCAIVRWPES